MKTEQFKVGIDNFNYIIYCNSTNKAVIIDCSYDVSDLIQYISTYNLNLEYIILTHYHNDHTSSYHQIKNKYPFVKTIASKIDSKNISFPIDLKISDNDSIYVGKISLKFLHTPGHTPGSICIIVDDKAIFTGDTLFIGDCGRVDLPGGNLNQMYHSLHEKLMVLPDNLIVYPGHDYGNKAYDLLENQKKYFSSYFKDVMHLINKN